MKCNQLLVNTQSQVFIQLHLPIVDCSYCVNILKTKCLFRLGKLITMDISHSGHGLSLTFVTK